ncbi:MAG: pyridoxal 5'-phosphate synthase glutaminase subunit PdxT [Candidatus Nanopelagicales bacterium]
MTVAPAIGVLAVQGDVREHLHALHAVGAAARAVGDVEALASVQGLVIPGGESTTISKLIVRDGLLHPLREARAAGLPMYGSCAGMIMLADEVLDGRPDHEGVGGLAVTVRRNAFGRQVDSFEADVPVRGLDGPAFPAVFIRAPWVESVSDQVDVLARIDRGGVDTIVAVRQGALLATSFHPELTGDHRIHEMFLSIVRQVS